MVLKRGRRSPGPHKGSEAAAAANWKMTDGVVSWAGIPS